MIGDWKVGYSGRSVIRVNDSERGDREIYKYSQRRALGRIRRVSFARILGILQVCNGRVRWRFGDRWGLADQESDVMHEGSDFEPMVLEGLGQGVGLIESVGGEGLLDKELEELLDDRLVDFWGCGQEVAEFFGAIKLD